jgi:hypothetical protein
MLHDQDLPKFLWAEACNIVVYLLNRSPHRVLGNVTLEEAFTGKKPDISHLRIFGCIVYCHIPAEKRTKLDPIQEKRILVGYNETSIAYRAYIPSTRKTVECRDINLKRRGSFRNLFKTKIFWKQKFLNKKKYPSFRAQILP